MLFYLGFILIGVLAGILGGIVGIGGGIIIVPALAYFYALSQKMAQGTSLAALLFPVGILAVWVYHKNQQVHWLGACLVATGFVLGGFLGAKLAVQISNENLRRIFGILLLVIGFKFAVFSGKG